MNDPASKKPEPRRKGRALLVAAASAAVLLMQGCKDVGSGNLIAFPQPDMAQQDAAMDMGVPSDLCSSDVCPSRD